MIQRLAVITFVVLLAGACGGGDSTPTGPSPTPSPSPQPAPPPPQPVTHSLSGIVTVDGTTIGARGITIHVLDGVNAGRETGTGSDGRYQLADMQTGNANVAARASGWEERRTGVHVSGATTLNFSTRTIEAWQVIASGSRVFDMPVWVTRVVIAAIYTGFCENFIVEIGGRLVVNEILGTCRSGVGTEFAGTFAASGTVVQVRATRITWGIREIRSASITTTTSDLLRQLR